VHQAGRVINMCEIKFKSEINELKNEIVRLKKEKAKDKIEKEVNEELIKRLEKKLNILQIAKEKEDIKNKIEEYSITEIKTFVFKNYKYTLYELECNDEVITKILDVWNIRGIGHRTYANSCEDKNITERFIQVIMKKEVGVSAGINYIYIYENAVEEILKEIDEEKKKIKKQKEEAEKIDELYNADIDKEIDNIISDVIKENNEVYVSDVKERLTIIKDVKEEVFEKTKLCKIISEKCRKKNREIELKNFKEKAKKERFEKLKELKRKFKNIKIIRNYNFCVIVNNKKRFYDRDGRFKFRFISRNNFAKDYFDDEELDELDKFILNNKLYFASKEEVNKIEAM